MGMFLSGMAQRDALCFRDHSIHTVGVGETGVAEPGFSVANVCRIVYPWR